MAMIVPNTFALPAHECMCKLSRLIFFIKRISSMQIIIKVKIDLNTTNYDQLWLVVKILQTIGLGVTSVISQARTYFSCRQQRICVIFFHFPFFFLLSYFFIDEEPNKSHEHMSRKVSFNVIYLSSCNSKDDLTIDIQLVEQTTMCF